MRANYGHNTEGSHKLFPKEGIIWVSERYQAAAVPFQLFLQFGCLQIYSRSKSQCFYARLPGLEACLYICIFHSTEHLAAATKD